MSKQTSTGTLLARGDPGLNIFGRLRLHLPRIGIGFLVFLLALELLFTRWDLPGAVRARSGHLFGLLGMSVAPGFAVGLYIYYRDRYTDTSTKLLARIFLYGLLLASAAGWAEFFMARLIGYRGQTATIVDHFVFYFAVVALSEEFIKFIVVWKLTYRTRMFKQVYDGILFCTASALGFATIENLFYVFTSGSRASEVALIRAITAVPTHITDGVIMGYGMGRARAVTGKLEEKEWLVIGFGGAVISHGAYDFLLTFGSIARYGFLVVMVAGWAIAFKALKKALADSPFTHCGACKRVIPQLASCCPFCSAGRRIALACPSCGSAITKWARKCLSCNARVRFPWHLQVDRLKDLYPNRPFTPCPSCSEEIPSNVAYCLHCGHRTAPPRKTTGR